MLSDISIFCYFISFSSELWFIVPLPLFGVFIFINYISRSSGGIVNTMGTTMRATSGAGTVNTPGELEVTAFSMVRVAQSLVCYAVLCRQLFVFLSLFSIKHSNSILNLDFIFAWHFQCSRPNIAENIFSYRYTSCISRFFSVTF
jgi:hypothetical protein